MNDAKDVLARIRAVRQPESLPDKGLPAAVSTLDSLAARRDAGSLLAGVAADRITDRALRPLRVAIAGTFTAENVAPLLRVELLSGGIAPEIHVSGFDQLLDDPEYYVLRPRGDHALKPDWIVLDRKVEPAHA